MSTDIPSFPGEEILPLAGAVITSAFCTNPARAIDDDPATAATFDQRGIWIRRVTKTLTVYGANANWLDTGVVVRPGEFVLFSQIGADAVHFDNGGSASYAQGQSNTLGHPGNRVTNCWGCGLAGAIRPDGSGPPVGIISDGLPFDPTIYVQNPAPYPEQLIATGGRLWVIVNDYDYSDNSGFWVIQIEVGPYDPKSRYLRAEWGSDRFVTRIRLRSAGPGALNAAVAFDSGFHPGSDVLVPYIPLPSDVTSGAGVDEIVLDVPNLATGVVFYPDFLAQNADEAKVVSLYQLQIYYERDLGMPNPTQTTTEWSQVGVQNMMFYPYNGVTGPYDLTTGSKLSGLQSLDFGETVTTAKITGGETTFQLGAHETGRELKFKVSAQIANLRVLAIIEGGALVVSPDNANGGEVQYHRPNKSDRAPYFQFWAYSDNGDGKLTLKLFKCKMDGAASYNLNKDQVSNLEFEFTAYWDPTAQCQDGTIGGIRELIHGAKGEGTLHS